MYLQRALCLFEVSITKITDVISGVKIFRRARNHGFKIDSDLLQQNHALYTSIHTFCQTDDAKINVIQKTTSSKENNEELTWSFISQ